MTTQDRITQVQIQGLKSIDSVTLDLDGLTVLIGDNGSGKSTILEALEILRKIPGPARANLLSEHGGLDRLLRQDSIELSLCLTTTGPQGQLTYTIEFNDQGIRYEGLLSAESQGPDRAKKLNPVFERTADIVKILSDDGQLKNPPHARIGRDTPILESLLQATPHTGIQRMCDVLEGIAIHRPFAIQPLWANTPPSLENTARQPGLVTHVKHLERNGANLASAIHTLKNAYPRKHWDKTLALIQLGLGDDIDDIRTPPAPGGGRVTLELHPRGLPRPLPAFCLSDGMLSWLAFVAMFRLDEGRSLLAFDEPESHLHPHLLMRVLSLFEESAEQHPVILATHSDRLLDGLEEPAKAVILTELNEDHATILRRPDEVALAQWLKRYKGLGELRSEGYLSHILAEEAG